MFQSRQCDFLRCRQIRETCNYIIGWGWWSKSRHFPPSVDIVSSSDVIGFGCIWIWRYVNTSIRAKGIAKANEREIEIGKKDRQKTTLLEEGSLFSRLRISDGLIIWDFGLNIFIIAQLLHSRTSISLNYATSLSFPCWLVFLLTFPCVLPIEMGSVWNLW